MNAEGISSSGFSRQAMVSLPRSLGRAPFIAGRSKSGSKQSSQGETEYRRQYKTESNSENEEKLSECACIGTFPLVVPRCYRSSPVPRNSNNPCRKWICPLAPFNKQRLHAIILPITHQPRRPHYSLSNCRNYISTLPQTSPYRSIHNNSDPRPDTTPSQTPRSEQHRNRHVSPDPSPILLDRHSAIHPPPP